MNVKFDRLLGMPIWYALKSSQGLVLNSFTPLTTFNRYFSKYVKAYFASEQAAPFLY